MTRNKPPFYGQDQNQQPHQHEPQQPGYSPPQNEYKPENQYPTQQQSYIKQQQQNYGERNYGASAEYYSYQTSNSNNAPPTVPYPGPPAPEDRGVLGALAGGAAGAYAGHKMGHGVVGAAGGAFAGHKLEDAWKHHHDHAQQQNDNGNQFSQHEEVYQAPTGPPPSYHASPQNMLGNFSASSAEISLDGDFDLIARCRDIHGGEKMTAFNLNKVLSNSNGHFEWVRDGGNFGASARNVSLVDGGRVLEAELRNVDGGWKWDRVWLDERIENDNGNLSLV